MPPCTSEFGIDAVFQRDLSNMLPVGTHSNYSSENPTVSSTNPSSNSLPVGIGAVALITIGAALLFTRLGYFKRATTSPVDAGPNKEEEPKPGYVTETEANFKLPPNILKTTKAALEIEPPLISPPPALIFHSRLETSPAQELPPRVQITGGPAPLSLRQLSDVEKEVFAMDALETPVEYAGFRVATAEYFPRQVIVAPRRKQSISLDVDTGIPVRPSSMYSGRVIPLVSIEDNESTTRSTPLLSLDTEDPATAKTTSFLPSKGISAQSIRLGSANLTVSTSQGFVGSFNSSTTSVSVASSKVMHYKVTEPWIPQRFDELELHVGEIVVVYQSYKDGWCEGCVEGSEEEEGMFPRVCLGQYAISISDLRSISPPGPAAFKNGQVSTATSSPGSQEHASPLVEVGEFNLETSDARNGTGDLETSESFHSIAS
ncbi:hypothetical protein BJ741DRAFT_617206 [Chytriomyces cf. hyalinus JEL632]|nr:hypothetical protein BJ741DRAFT_617206 [Chytriomyces cf. hyalinus JEL632]